MSISDYINQIKEDKNLTYKQLAMEMKIGYPNLVALKNNKDSIPSVKVLNILSKYLNKSKEKVLCEILRYDLDSVYSEASLMKLCELYLDGYAIKINAQMPNPFKPGFISFDGTAYKKRTGYKFTVIDSFTRLEEEFNELFKNPNSSDDKINLKEYCKNYKTYVSCVLHYGLAKLDSCNFDHVDNFIITVNKENEYDSLILEEALPKKYKTKTFLYFAD